MGGGPTGGGMCHDLKGCVAATQSVVADTGCPGGSRLTYSLKNGCGQAAYCRVCPLVGGSVDESRCEETTLPIGAFDNASGNYFCAAQAQYACAQATDPTQCVKF